MGQIILVGFTSVTFNQTVSVFVHALQQPDPWPGHLLEQEDGSHELYNYHWSRCHVTYQSKWVDSIIFGYCITLNQKKKDQPYSSYLDLMRCLLSFTFLCSSIQCISGAHSAPVCISKQFGFPTDIHVVKTGIAIYLVTSCTAYISLTHYLTTAHTTHYRNLSF